jgi:hypothetical protein
MRRTPEVSATMMTFEKLDAWKSCHELVLTTFKEIDSLPKGDTDIRQRLRATCLRAAAKVAFGAGSGNTKMFATSLMRSAGYLSEFAYHLSIARVIGDLPDGVCTKLAALRGRAAFYTWQLLKSLIAPPAPEGGGEEAEEDAA